MNLAVGVGYITDTFTHNKTENNIQGCKLIRDEKGDNDAKPLGGSGACSPGNIFYIQEHFAHFKVQCIYLAHFDNKIMRLDL